MTRRENIICSTVLDLVGRIESRFVQIITLNFINKISAVIEKQVRVNLTEGRPVIIIVKFIWMEYKIIISETQFVYIIDSCNEFSVIFNITKRKVVMQLPQNHSFEKHSRHFCGWECYNFGWYCSGAS